MQITHEQARTLIQFSLDGILQSSEQSALSAHLQECVDCRAYGNELKDVEAILLPAIKKKWDVRPIPLSVHALVQRKNSGINVSDILTTRKAMVVVAILALFFGAWQFIVSGPPDSGQLTLAVPPMPIPSVLGAPSTNTKVILENCETMPYIVQANDTLASIADRFSIAEEEIIMMNQLKTDAVRTSMELIIPICNSTPTGTVNPATFTTTYTPTLKHVTSTPGG